jgi:hypothetical protein
MMIGLIEFRRTASTDRLRMAEISPQLCLPESIDSVLLAAFLLFALLPLAGARRLRSTQEFELREAGPSSPETIADLRAAWETVSGGIR